MHKYLKHCNTHKFSFASSPCIQLYDDAEFDKFSPMLQVSPEGVVTRDEKVFRLAKDQNIPLLMLTSGEILLTQVCGPFL